MKRFLTILLAIIMILSLTACSSGSGDSDEESGTSSDGGSGTVADEGTQATTGANTDFELPDDLPALKIGCIGVYSGNELYIQWRTNLEALADAFNIEFQFVEPDSTATEEYVTAVENLATAEFDAVMTQAYSETIAQVCEENGMGYMVYCTSVPQDTLDVLATYSSFCGVLGENDEIAAEAAAQAMYDAGCREVAVLGMTKGSSEMMDLRAERFIEAFTALGGNICAEDYSLMEFSDAISTFAAGHPEMDGIYSVILNETVFQTFTTEGLVGSVKLAGFDVSESTPTFFDNDTLVYTCTGQSATIVSAFAALYNYLYDGTYIIEDRASQLERAWIEIGDMEDYNNYDEYIRFSTCYSAEEIGEMIIGLNPDYTPADYAQMNLDFSIEDVMERTANANAANETTEE